MNKNKIYKWILIPIIIVVLDLVLKFWIRNHFEYGQGLGILNNTFYITNIKTIRMSLGFNNSFAPFTLISIVLELIFLFLFIKVQRIKIQSLFKISTLFIFFGLLGNYADKLLLSNGEKGYVRMDYLAVPPLSSAFFNLCTVLCYVGWLLLIIAVIKNFGDAKKIFFQKKSK